MELILQVWISSKAEKQLWHRYWWKMGSKKATWAGIRRLRGIGARLREVKPIAIKWLRGNPSRKRKGSNYGPVWGVTAYNAWKLKIKPISLDSRENIFKSKSNQAGNRSPKGDSQDTRMFPAKQIRCKRERHVRKHVLWCRGSGLRFSLAVRCAIKIWRIHYRSAILHKRLITDCATLWAYCRKIKPQTSFSSPIPMKQWK